MKKCVLFIVLASAITVVKAQQTSRGIVSKGTIVAEAKAAKGAEVNWENAPFAAMLRSSKMPEYDSVINFEGIYETADVNENTKNFFSKVFNSRTVTMNTRKHQYSGEGRFIFCVDKKTGMGGIYNVYYTFKVGVKHNKIVVNISDFVIKNQNVEVSFAYLANRAKNNDAAALKVLSFFHNNNLLEINKLMQTAVPELAANNQGMALAR